MKNYSKIVIIFIPIFVWLFYSGIIFKGSPIVKSNSFNYFKYLSDSILKGKFDIECPPTTDCLDLVYYKEKYYLYWPWVPALIYIPLVIVWGTNVPDTLIVSFFGAVNILLIIIFIRRFSTLFNLGITSGEIIFLSLFWGLGTVHFYMSMVGSVWFVSQIMAQTFLISALILSTYVTVWQVVFSAIFFSMAVYTKNNLIFSIFFFISIWMVLHKDTKNRYNKIIVFFVPLFLFTVINFFYNYIRFGDFFENGIKYHLMSDFFKKNYLTYGYLSFVYVPYNFLREVLIPPPFTLRYPYFKYDIEGFGFLWNSPLFLFAFAVIFIYLFKIILGKKSQNNFNLNKKDIILFTGTFFSLVFIALLIFSIMGSGRAQFASRYSLDYQIYIFVFLLYAFKFFRQYRWFYPAVIFLILISFYMNLMGVRFFVRP